ncbi:MAG: FAD-dependent oxidoreductase [gamma proteobacterium symbiont of Bathyaustriella thionipta]|nr:FAD-dependent oxidoreductase [gamma proteobacterium symbiont of Bathyaustriella thionipta]
MALKIQAEVVIFGAGIAGLWTLARLLDAGMAAILLETRAIGGVQTLASQGIIHGGSKYALGGRLTPAAQAIAGMPARWRACLQGQGEIDLRQVRVLSEHQYLWTQAAAGSRLAAFFAGRLMRDRMQRLQPHAYPQIFNTAAFAGRLYQLQEPVLDVGSLMQVLYERSKAHCVQVQADSIHIQPARDSVRISADSQQKQRLEIEAQQLLLAAGQGNERLLRQAGISDIRQQLRPLHMLMLEGDLPPLYAHCLAAGVTPSVSITSHPGKKGRVWYLGGELAESGVKRNPQQQIEAGRRLLQQRLPWLDTRGMNWRTLRIQRAEACQAGGVRPDRSILLRRGRLQVCWPTKLAFAPLLADQVLASFRDCKVNGMTSQPFHNEVTMGRLPWLRPTA